MKNKQNPPSISTPTPPPGAPSYTVAGGGRWCRKVLLAVLAVYCIFIAVHLWRHAGDYQNDLKVYLAAAKAFERGLNPYEARNLLPFTGGKVVNPYHYPAAALILFQPLAHLGGASATKIFLALKLAALAALILLWRFFFFRGRVGPFFYFLCLLGFNGTIYIDLCAGNISIFEQLALWAGFAFLLRRRFIPFAALVIAVALFKITPVAFLGLPLLFDGRAAWRRCAIAGGVFVALLALATVLTPFGSGFWNLSGEQMPLGHGVLAPSTMALAHDFCGAVSTGAAVALPVWTPQALYLAAVAAILFFSWRAWRRGSARDPRATLMLACLVYALLLPRFKDYNYILLLPPAYYALVRLARRGVPGLLPLWPLAYPMIGIFRLPGFGFWPSLLINYYPWVTAVTIWWIYAYWMGEEKFDYDYDYEKRAR